jgi:hypothetical protein
MRFLLLWLLLFLGVAQTLYPSPLSQLSCDGIILAFFVLLPLIKKRRAYGAEILTSQQSSAAPAYSVQAGLDQGKSSRVGIIFVLLAVWIGLLAVAYLLSLALSWNMAATLHACRQVLGGIVVFMVVVAVCPNFDSFLDLLLALGAVGWLVLAAGPGLQEIFPLVQSEVAHWSSLYPELPGEGVRRMAIAGAMALESWIVATILLSIDGRKRWIAILFHIAWWTFWGAMGTLKFLPVLVAAFTITFAVTPPGRTRRWSWALGSLLSAGAGWFFAHFWLIPVQRMRIVEPEWFVAMGRPADSADWAVGAFHFPWGVGALGHEYLLPAFEGRMAVSSLPGGQLIIWLSDLGLLGPVLAVLLIVLIIRGISFLWPEYLEHLEPTRDPQSMRELRESDYPVSPVVVPSTLLSWLVCGVALIGLDLFRFTFFWFYLGLWGGWLAQRRTGSLSQRRKWMIYALSGVFFVFFLLLAGSRELGRRSFRKALEVSSLSRKKVALQDASYWDRWNAEYPILLSRLFLQEGRSRPGALADAQLSAQRALRLAPADARAYEVLSRVARAEGLYGEAIDYAGKAIYYSPATVKYRWDLAELFESVGRPEAAEAEYRIIAAMDSGDPQVHLALARLAEKRNEPDKALAAYRRVLLLNRDHPTALRRYERLKNRIDGRIPVGATIF